CWNVGIAEIDIAYSVLLKKGKTNLAIYGIGSQRDDRLCRACLIIRFLRPREDPTSWFNILVLHQNRPRRSKDRSTGAHLPESLIPTFFDLVIWGHEHECKIGTSSFLIYPLISSRGQFTSKVVEVNPQKLGKRTSLTHKKHCRRSLKRC
uniref:Double-strand break repair protein MRE11 n=1 Tax=Parascaris equorum TaxID=6256 RepID=A0A914RES2_PAREQ